jgi:exopolysaccharide production protein ExoQ
MNPQLAFLICGAGIAGLFFLDRDKTTRTSPALWLPVLYISILASRPVSMWLGGGGGGASGDALAATLDGSPEDAAVFGILIAAAIVALVRRKKTGVLLKACAPIIIYYLYCLLSTVWSPFSGPSFKRWIKCVGDLVMVLVIVTDPQPLTALQRIYSRIGFVLFPLSVIFIKCTNLGVVYDELGPHYTGVTTNKNAFGLMLYILTIGVVWNIRTLLLDKKSVNRRRRLLAQVTLLGFGIVLLQMAHSATSVFCFVLGSGLILATGLPIVKRRPSMLHALCLGILVVGSTSILFGGTGAVTSAMGRSSDLSGRTEIWAAALAVDHQPLLGSGFESFWNANAHQVARILSHYQNIADLNSAHDGYLQIYLDLGWVGVILLACIIIGGYFRVTRAFRRCPELTSLFLAYLITCAFYSLTEAGFRIMTLSWIFLLLAVVGGTGVIIGVMKVNRYERHAQRASAAVEKVRVGRRASAALAGSTIA